MVHLYDKKTGVAVGTIDEKSEQDNDYYINTEAIEMFRKRGADHTLLNLLRTALHGRKEMEIRWQRPSVLPL